MLMHATYSSLKNVNNPIGFAYFFFFIQSNFKLKNGTEHSSSDLL